jgi:hypothetical protein
VDTGMMKRNPQILKGRSNNTIEGQEFAIWLDQDSVQRLGRLKDKLRQLDDNDLVALALKSLERQINIIVRKRALEKIRTLEKKKLSSQQIADQLNKQGVSVPDEAQKWNAGTIDRLLRPRRDAE